jgi:peptidoglycan/LPS O-acetylase OafA/YrhL
MVGLEGGLISPTGNETALADAAPLADGADAKWPVREFFRAHVWLPLAETIGEAYRKQYYPLGYTPALDGLRGLMTVGVMVAHVYSTVVPVAMLFMDVFFVMSGYFITSLLVRDIQRYGGIRYGEFYRRRFARILPPFLVMVLAYLLFRSIFVPPFRDALVDALIAFTYITNWWLAFHIPGIIYMAHTWSLAIEEQFYLLWPITLAVLVRICGVRWRLVCVIGAIALAGWGWTICLTTIDPPWWRLYFGLDTRADALMVGGALGVALKLAPAGAYPKVERFLPKLAWPFIIGFLAMMFFFAPGKHFYGYVGTMVCGALPGAVLVTLLVRTSGTALHCILERPEIVFLGKIFYGMYLWHNPILGLMKDLGAPNLVLVFVGFPLTVLMATLSYAYIERHFMRVRSAPAQPVAAVPTYASTSS